MTVKNELQTLTITGVFQSIETSGAFSPQRCHCYHIGGNRTRIDLDDPAHWIDTETSEKGIRHNHEGEISELYDIRELSAYLSQKVFPEPTAQEHFRWDATIDEFRRLVASNLVSSEPGKPVPPPLEVELETQLTKKSTITDFVKVVDTHDREVEFVHMSNVDTHQLVSFELEGQQYKNEHADLGGMFLYLNSRFPPGTRGGRSWVYGLNNPELDSNVESKYVFYRTVERIYEADTPDVIVVKVL